MSFLLFNEALIRKKAFSLRAVQETHEVLERSALTLLERFSWSHKKYLNVLIIGPYGHILKKHIDNFLMAKDYPVITVTQFNDFVFDSAFLPFCQDSFDCIFSFFDMQWVNDVPGYLKQLQYILKPGGLLNGVFIGGDSFIEMKEQFSQMEMQHGGGVSLAFMPTIHASDAASLVQRAGFMCPVSDRYFYQFNAQWKDVYIALKKLCATGFLLRSVKFSKEKVKHLSKLACRKHTVEVVFFSGLGVGCEGEKGENKLFSTENIYLGS